MTDKPRCPANPQCADWSKCDPWDCPHVAPPEPVNESGSQERLDEMCANLVFVNGVGYTKQ